MYGHHTYSVYSGDRFVSAHHERETAGSIARCTENGRVVPSQVAVPYHYGIAVKRPA